MFELLANLPKRHLPSKLLTWSHLNVLNVIPAISFGSNTVGEIWYIFNRKYDKYI